MRAVGASWRQLSLRPRLADVLAEHGATHEAVTRALYGEGAGGAEGRAKAG
ncbi:hypothetical protein [Streptomyces sp. NPDC048496]|uniref:hypothetical protein n=1 Tax=Streptomyces sp. NPDC048496 TaxID=3365558 RepID=UPI00372295A3